MGELIDIPSPEEQKETIEMQLTKSLVNGETWYLIYSKWMSSFKQFIGLEKTGGSQVSHPGPIDNSSLFDEQGELRKALVDKMDYEVVPTESWNLLVQWYGYSSPQPISRKVITIAPKYLSIEVYPVELKCFKNAESKKHTKLVVSKEDSLTKVNNELKRIFNINQNTNTRLLVAVGEGVPYCPDLDNTVAGSGLLHGSTVIIETAEDGGWPRNIRQIKTGSNTNTKNSGNNSSSIYFGPSVGASSSTKSPILTTLRSVSIPTQRHHPLNLPEDLKQELSQYITSFGRIPTLYKIDYPLSFAGGGRTSRTSTMGTNASTLALRQPGVCGLNNLGNTCFMNSVLQCMSNCPPITEYFLSDKHMLELNETNPLGMKGEIARVYGELIQAMWSGNYATANPLPFKIQVGKFNPTFSGCQQHDSQELLTFLLDGLHEDLNRIKKKPYIEVKDQVGRPDCEVAREAWDNYRKRNDSVIVDTFHGLLKSRVVCPECERVSVTFDPFCYLSLPLPLKKDRVLTVRYIPFDGYKRESSFRVSVPRKGIIRDLCQELSAKVGCSSDQLLVAEIAHCHFHKFYSNEDTLDNIDEKDVIFVYQLPVLPLNVDDEEDIIVPVCFWEKVKPIDRFAQNHLFGVPFLTSIPRRPVSSVELNNILKEKMRRHFVFYNDMDAINGENTCNKNDAGSSQEKCFPLFTMDTTRATPNPQPLEFVNGLSNIKDIMEENYNNRYFGRMILIVQMTAEERRELYREKPAEYGPDLMLSQPASVREKNAKVDIVDCISLFTTCEKLSADDAWYCPACRKHQRATKKFDLWKLPKILIIHLKRFSYTRCRRDKIDSLVEFPINDLNISNYVINTEGPDMKYDLIGVCNHYGHMGGGHYTSYCKNKNTKEWYCFDDNSVSLQSEENIMSSAAYVLFYMAKESIPSGDPMDIN